MDESATNLAVFAIIAVVTFQLHGTATQVLAGVFVDRWHLKGTMIASDLIRGVLMLAQRPTGAGDGIERGTRFNAAGIRLHLQALDDFVCDFLDDGGNIRDALLRGAALDLRA